MDQKCKEGSFKPIPKSKKNCVVPHCTKTGYRLEGDHGLVTFHKFPEDPTLKAQWITNIHRDEGELFKVTEHSKVCSLHFTSDQWEIHSFSGRRTLNPGAVPNEFKCWEFTCPHLYKENKVRRELLRHNLDSLPKNRRRKKQKKM